MQSAGAEAGGSFLLEEISLCVFFDAENQWGITPAAVNHQLLLLHHVPLMPKV